MFIIDFLKDNSEAMIVSLTFFLVCITVWYVYETRKIRINANYPKLQVSLLYVDDNWKQHTLNLCIQNIGTGFAYDLKFDGNLSSVKFSYNTLADNKIMKNGISHLGPGKRCQIPLSSKYKGEELDSPEEPLSIDVNYEDSAKKKKKYKCCLYFTKVEDYTQIGDPSLESIAESLRRIAILLRHE